VQWLKVCGRGFSDQALANDDAQPQGNNRYAFPALTRAAGEMHAAGDDGPRIAAMEIGGWDTHVAQVPRLARVLNELEAGLAALNRTGERHQGTDECIEPADFRCISVSQISPRNDS
jgi:uncharacterized protein (DUF1501 family)